MNFEDYNKKDGGNIYIVAPGIVNPESAENLNVLLSSHDPQIILLTYDKYLFTLINFCNLVNILKRQGYQVLVEYDTDFVEYLDEQEIIYTSIISTPSIFEPIAKSLQRHYTETQQVFKTYYIDFREIDKISDYLRVNPKIITIDREDYKIRKVISNYLFMGNNCYTYS